MKEQHASTIQCNNDKETTKSSFWQRRLHLTHLPLETMFAIVADDIFKCIFLNKKLCILIKKITDIYL